MGTVNKGQLAEQIAARTGASKREAEAMLNAFTEVVGQRLGAGDRVTITGFGTFESRKRAARTGVNPRDPSTRLQIPASTAAAFRPGSQLKAAVAGTRRATKKATSKASKKASTKKASTKKASTKRTAAASTAGRATAKKAAKKR